MSIDRNIFIREFSMFLDHHGKKMNDLIVQRYLEFLDAHLTTEEFVQASRFIILEDQFFPTARRFVDVVRGSGKQQAAAEWQQVLKLAQAGNPDLSSLSPAGRAAVKAAGGWRAIAFAEGDYQLDRARKAFTEAFEIETQAPALPAIASTPRPELEVVR